MISTLYGDAYGDSEVNHDSCGRQNGKHSIELSKHAAVEVEEIETGVAKVVAVEDVENFSRQRHLPSLEQKRFTQPHIDAVVKRYSRLITLLGEKVSLRVLAKEARYRLPTPVAQLTT